MNLIKRLFMGAVGLVLVLSGIRLMVATNVHWVLDLLLGGAAAVGAGLLVKAMIGGKED